MPDPEQQQRPESENLAEVIEYRARAAERIRTEHPQDRAGLLWALRAVLDVGLEYGEFLDRLPDEVRLAATAEEVIGLILELADGDPAPRGLTASMETAVWCLAKVKGRAPAARELLARFQQRTAEDPDRYLPLLIDSIPRQIDDLADTDEKEALLYSQRLLFGCEPFLRLDPPRLVRQAASAHTRHARLLASVDQPGMAVHHSARAVELGEAAARGGDDDTVRVLLTALSTHVRRLNAIGDEDGATEAAVRFVAVSEQLGGLAPMYHVKQYLDLLVRHDEDAAIDALERAVATAEPLVEATDHRNALADTVNLLVKRLHAARRCEEALAYSDKALELWQGLYADRLEPHEPWADALNDRVAALLALRRPQEALEPARRAVEWYGLLCDRDPDDRSMLGTALFNLHLCLDRVGDHEEALACAVRMIQLYEGLRETHPGKRAEAYQDYGQQLRELNRHSEAVAHTRFAVARFEELAKSDADYKVDLAHALSSMTITLQRSGAPVLERLRVSERVAELEDDLAATHPERDHDRAHALRNHSISCDNAGRPADALAAAARAVEVAGEVEQDPEGRHLLADCLDQYAVRLREFDRAAEAVEHSTRAIELYEGLITEDRETYLLHGAMAMDNHAGHLEALKRFEEAVEFSARALALLAEAGAETKAPNAFADTLGNHANRLISAGRTEEALDVSERNLEMRRRAAEANSGRGKGLGLALAQRAWVLAKNGRGEEALSYSEQAVAAFEELSTVDRPQHLPTFAEVLGRRADYLYELGRAEDAATVARQVVELREEQAEGADWNLPALAKALDWAEYYHSEAKQPEGCEEYGRRYVELADRLGISGDAPGDFAAVLHRLAWRCKTTGRSQDAIAFAERAAALREELAATVAKKRTDTGDPVDLAELARTLRILAELHIEVGRATAASRYLARALELSRTLITVDRPKWIIVHKANLENAGWVWYDADPEAALEATAEYLALAEEFDDPDGSHYDLAYALDVHACAHARLGRDRPALEFGSRALPLWLAIDAENADTAWCRTYLAEYLSKTGKATEAVEESTRAIAMYRALYTKDPELRGDLACALRRHAHVLHNTGGDPEAAIEAAREAVEHHEALAADEPLVQLPDLARTLLTAARVEAGPPAELFARAVHAYERLEAAEPGVYTELAAAASVEAEDYAKGRS